MTTIDRPSAPPRPWRVLLDGALADEARDALAEIASSLVDAKVEEPGVSRGAAGLALFFGYYGAVFEDAASLERGARWLQRAIVTSRGGTDLSLYTGASGIGWTLEHLAATDASAADPNVELDTRLSRVVAVSPWKGSYDLISGLVGFAVYALERLPRPGAMALLERIVEHLDRLAEHRGSQVSWHTPSAALWPGMQDRAPAGLYDLGVAHGVPGVIGVLARIVAAGLAAPTAGRLLDGAIAWLRAHQHAGESRFPAWVSTDGAVQKARTAWCYGDPGIAAILLGAGVLLRQSAWVDLGVEIARTAAARPIGRSGVVDTCLCHGAFGLGLTFLRCWQICDEPLFRDAARRWFAHGLATRRAGFPWFEPATKSWQQSPGFLQGSAGGALALLAALSSEEPSWDRLLLLS